MLNITCLAVQMRKQRLNDLSKIPNKWAARRHTELRVSTHPLSLKLLQFFLSQLCVCAAEINTQHRILLPGTTCGCWYWSVNPCFYGLRGVSFPGDHRAGSEQVNHCLIWIAGGRAMSAKDFHTFCLCRTWQPQQWEAQSQWDSRCGKSICLEGCSALVVEQLVSSEYKRYREICELRKLLARCLKTWGCVWKTGRDKISAVISVLKAWQKHHSYGQKLHRDEFL